MKWLSFITFLLLFDIDCLAQNNKAKVIINIEPKAGREKEFNKLENLRIAISIKNGDSVIYSVDSDIYSKSNIPKNITLLALPIGILNMDVRFGSHYMTFEKNINQLIQYKDIHIKDRKLNPETPLIIKISFPPYCKYDLHRTNKICPICHKQDKALPIMYGLPIIAPEEDSSSNSPQYHLGGCELSGCDPYWHCERDNIDF